MKRIFTVLFLIAVCFGIAFFLCTKLIPEDFFPAAVSTLQGQESFHIISLDPNTKLQITWAYEAKVKQSQRQKIEEYQRIGDISFKRFVTTEDWIISDEGYLQTDRNNTQINFSYPKFSNSVFVFCLRTVGGDAIVRHNYPGGHTFIRIEGKNSDALPVSSATSSTHPWKIPILLSIILSGIILSSISVFLFLRWISKHPLIEPEPLQKKNIDTDLFLYTASFLIPFLLALAVCLLNGFAPFGTKTFLYNDMSNQNYRFFLYLKNMFREHNDFFYSFSKTMGGTMLNFVPYYLLDPLIYLIFLFPEEKIPAYCTFLILTHLGCGGLTSFLYLRKNERSVFSSLLFSCAYALMAFNIVCADNPYFLTGMIILPIVLLGLEREIRQRQPLLFILSLAFTLFSNFYFGWMVCIFTFIWFLFIEISEKRDSFLNDLITFILHSLLAVGLIMVMILPLLASLGGSQKDFSIRRMIPEFLTSATGLLSKLFTSSFNHAQITTVKEGNPSLFCGMVSTVFTALWFTQKNKENRGRFCALSILAIFLLSFSVSSFYLIWHAFNYPLCWPDRFSFTFGFLIIYLASEAFDNRQNFSTVGIFSILVIFSAVSFVVYKANFEYLSDEIILLDWCIITFILICLLPKIISNTVINKLFPAAAICLLIPDLFLNMAHIWNTSYSETLSDSGISADVYLQEYQDMSIPIKKIRDADISFYRTEFAVRKGDNQGFRFSTNTISHYSSTNNLDSMLFLDRMGFSAAYTGKSNYRYGSTMAADSLLGVKYIVSEPELAVKPYSIIDQNKSVIFQLNPNALSLGMVAFPNILTVSFESNKPFSNQENLISALFGEPIDLFTPVSEPKLQTENLSSESQEQYTVFRKIDSDSPGRLTWDFVSVRDEMLYAWFPVLSQRTGYVTLNGREIGKTIDPRNYGVIPLGIFEPGTPVSISLQFDGESISLFDAVFMYEDIEKLDEIFSRDISMSNLIKHKSSYLEGTITSEKK